MRREDWVRRKQFAPNSDQQNVMINILVGTAAVALRAAARP
jgi:hypothetical protein